MKGIFVVVEMMVELMLKGVIMVVGGGDFVVVVEKVGLVDKMSYVLMGGGVSLELLEGKVLLGVVVLDDVCIYV